jgi:hypothetical protein
MRRRISLIIPFLLLTLLVTAVTAEMPQRGGLPAGVQDNLDRYMASPFAPSQPTVLTVGRARRPWNFSRDLSDGVLGDSVYFQTDGSLSWTVETGPSPLPFPPKELWCALLVGQDDADGTESYAVVLVGLHMDMYSGDWLVHETADGPFTPTSEDTLSRIGCEIGLN